MGESRGVGSGERSTDRFEDFDEGFVETVRLGHDLRFVLVCVGGGAARIGQAIAARRPRYVETVVINCDARVSGMEEFDRRVCLGATGIGAPETGGSAVIGGQLARAAEPALERIFENATFVTVVVSLGGGTGTGALPFVLEAASRRAAVLSVFAVKPFRWEGERRSLAERALGRLHFVDGWAEKLDHHLASLTILDNEALVAGAEKLTMNRLNAHWADVVATHIEKSFVLPAEAAMEAERLAALAEPEPLLPPAVQMPPAPPPVPAAPEPILPGLPALSAYLPSGGLPEALEDAELTFEIMDAGPRGPGLS